LTRFAAQRRDSLFAVRDSLLSQRDTWSARIDSLRGAAVAPLDEAIDGAVVIPAPASADTDPPVPLPADSLRAEATRLEAALAALVVPDSTEIIASGFLPGSVLADSIYCRAPLVLRFESITDTTRVTDIVYDGSEFDVADVPSGAYRGRVWRDLVSDEQFDATLEPGVKEPITVWVPPGEAGIVDTLSMRRADDSETSP
jgi:hypothetical protein